MSQSESWVPERDRPALIAVAAQFFVNGAVFASYVPRLPEIRDRVGIDIDRIGLLLALAGGASLAGSAVVGRIVERFGTRSTIFFGSTVICGCLVAVGQASAQVVLALALVGMMLFDVFVDVSMNLQGSWLSAKRSVPVVNRLHGLWSLGTVVGGVASSRLAANGVSLSTHLLVAAALLWLVVLGVTQNLPKIDLGFDEGEPETAAESAGADGLTSSTGSSAWRRAVILFFFAGAFALAAEGTSLNWAAFRLRDDFGTTPGFAVWAYVAFTVGMTVARFLGDWFVAQIGAHRHVTASAVVSGVGLAVATLGPSRWLVIGGYLLAGLGVASLLPILYDQAAKLPGRRGAGLGALTAGLRSADLTLPIIVGALAATSLSVGTAVALVALPCMVGFLLAIQGIRRLDSTS